MGEKDEASKNNQLPVIVQSEGMFNAGIILSESNYDVWSQLIEMHIAEREKISYIRGKLKPLAESEDGYEKWYAENQKVKRWLLMSMKPEIMKRYVRLPTAYAIWTALEKAFYDGSDELQIFALNQRAFTTKQNGRSLSDYYGELIEIFQELDHRDKVIMKDPDDVKAYQKSVERLRVHIFLAGLDECFEWVRGDTLRRDSTPTLEDCYALIRREATRQSTFKGESENSEAAAMFVRNKSKGNKNYDKSMYKCSHCNETGHTREKCYEIVGYPSWWDPCKAPKKNSKRSQSANVVVEVKPNDEHGEVHSAMVTTAGNGGYSNETDDWLWY